MENRCAAIDCECYFYLWQVLLAAETTSRLIFARLELGKKRRRITCRKTENEYQLETFLLACVALLSTEIDFPSLFIYRQSQLMIK